MTSEISQDLTTLDYITLGLVSRSPDRSAPVAMALYFGVSRWSASHDDTYKRLRSLQRKALITNKRAGPDKKLLGKNYRLTPQGEKLLDQWLKDMRGTNEPVAKHDIMLLKFV